MKKYSYVTFKAELIAPALQARTNPDSFVSADAITVALWSAINHGFRWMHTTPDGWAVFEKEIEPIQLTP